AVLLQAFHRGDLRALGLDREDGAGLHRLAIEQHRASAAVGGVAADVRAGQAQVLAEQVDEKQSRLDLHAVRSAVDGQLDVMRGHGYRPPARSTAFFSARAASTRAISRLYSTVPRRSAVGAAASAARRAASAMLASLGLFPIRTPSAAAARAGTGPALVRARPTCAKLPVPSSVTCAAAAAVAKSPTLRSSFMYAPLDRFGGTGMRISVRISSAASAVANSPVKKRSIGIVRSPSGPCATTIARSASIVAGWSLAGSPCARFPPTVARLRTRGSAM